DIDGLRAIAVLAVVGFHAFPGRVPGGFVGVDVFFVISGYLISGIIFSALAQDRFSFSDFYARRIRRIFPALVLVLATTYAAGWFLLFADRFAQLGKHVAGGAGFVANYLLWFEAGYFDASSDTKPLLHLWSLGIEEQFYLVWPFVAWAAWKRRLDLLAVTLLVFAGSMYFNLDRIRRDLVGTFYAPQTRFWELMAGAILAHLSTLQPQVKSMQWLRDRYLAITSSVARQVMSASGAVLIATAFAVIDQSRHFPGRWALLPVGGAALLIAAGPDAIINRHLLSLRPVVGVGLISYPLYLWHWPLLSILRLVEGETPTVTARWMAVVASFVLAWLTYVAIERPIRFGARRRAIVPVLCVLLAATGAVGLLTLRAEGIWSRSINRADKAAFAAYYDAMRRRDIAVPYRLECDFMELVTDRTKATLPPSCTTRGEHGTWFLWGDSHAQALSPGITSLLPGGIALAQVATSSCRPSLDAIDPQVPGERCVRANAFALGKIAELKPAVLILAQAGEHLSPDWSALARHAHGLGVERVVLVGPGPMWVPNLPEIFINRFWDTAATRIAFGLSSPRLVLDEQLRQRYAASTTLTYVSLINRLCNGEGCVAVVPGSDPPELMTFDAAHLTPMASRYVANQVLRPALLATP
ncbi:MAG: acyltransferase family protein, partial [Acidimicrobiia bacterium]